MDFFDKAGDIKYLKGAGWQTYLILTQGGGLYTLDSKGTNPPSLQSAIGGTLTAKYVSEGTIALQLFAETSTLFAFSYMPFTLSSYK